MKITEIHTITVNLSPVEVRQILMDACLEKASALTANINGYTGKRVMLYNGGDASVDFERIVPTFENKD